MKKIYILLISSLLVTSCNTNDVVKVWYYNKINVDILERKDKKKDIVVGIVDSGINKSFLKLFKEDTFINGYDFIDIDDKPYSNNNMHGSYISYLIAGDYIDGFKGIDTRLKIMPIRVFDEIGASSEELIYKGIEYAINNGCNVINMSFTTSNYSERIARLINDNDDIIFVSSVGDLSASSYSFPGCLDKVIRVSAVDEQGTLYEYSNKSNVQQSILAPGVNIPIVSVNYNNDIINTIVSGSSFATAIVSGIIAFSLKYTTPPFKFSSE